MALPKRQKEPSNPKGRCDSVSMGFPLIPYQASLLGSFDLNEYRLQLGFTWVREGKIYQQTSHSPKTHNCGSLAYDRTPGILGFAPFGA